MAERLVQKPNNTRSKPRDVIIAGFHVIHPKSVPLGFVSDEFKMKKRDVKVISLSTKFHKYHGSNIILYDDNTVAYRKASYADALTFSEKPLKPGEIFLLEIELTEIGWTGDMRIGLTQLNPCEAEAASLILPQFAIPDLSSMKSSWIYAITQSQILNRLHSGSSLTGEKKCIQTCHGSVPFSSLQPTISDINTEILPTDVGSRIGIFYIPVPRNDRSGEKEVAELHFIINGEDQGVFAKDIPFTEGPLYVVIDVYGCTKQVRIVQVTYGVASLQSTCREAILNHIKQSAVAKLPLPKPLKEYLLDNVRQLS